MIMKINTSRTINLLIRLIKHLPKQRKKGLILIIPVAIFSGIADVFVVTFGARLFNAFVGIPNQPSLPFSENLSFEPKYKILGLVIIFVLSTWIAAFLKLFLKGFQYKLKASIWRDLCEIAHNKILLQNYEYFLGTNKNNIIYSVLVNIGRVSDIIVLPLLQLISGTFVVTFISIAVLSIGKNIAIYLIFSLLIGFTSISLLVTPYIRKAAKKRIELVKETNNILRESMDTILDVHLTSSEPFFKEKYSLIGKKTIPFIWKSTTLPEMPRALLEPFGITLIFAIGLTPIFLNGANSTDLIKLLPFLGTIAIASLKLTPALQDGFRAYTSLRGGLPNLSEVLEILDLPISRLTIRSKGVPHSNKIIPKKFIRLSNIFYRYPNNHREVIKDINLEIPTGTISAFVGKTGSGKTTTANILLGLLKPTSGKIFLDEYSLKNKDIPAWQNSCAYVPQTINLLNKNIINNVAFGVENNSIDIDKVWEALRCAKLENIVLELPQGIYTHIGENGIKLSGGQRQRLAIARAIYRNSKFIILDEATSALDNKTESEVMGAIENIGKSCTIVVIAHRLSTVIRADNIYEFADGKIKASGNYCELKKKSDSFNQLTQYESNLIAKDDKDF